MSTNRVTREEIIGAWELVSWVVHSEKSPSDVQYPMGKDAKGTILYTLDGYMSAQLQSQGQEKIASAFAMDGPEADLAESARRFVGYSGRFDLDDSGPAPVLLHHFYVSSWPNWIGDTQRRVARLEGDQLILTLESPVEMKVSDVSDRFESE